MLNYLMNIFLRKLSPLGNFGNNLLVIIGDLKFLRQAAAKFSSAASKLTSNGNNLFHYEIFLSMGNCLV